jgi:hypothetical protein
VTESIRSAPVRAGETGNQFDVAAGTQKFHQALDSVNEELARNDGPLAFTEKGAAELMLANSRFTRDLAVSAIRLARVERMDMVSGAHVERAVGSLVKTDRDGRRTICLTLGGVFSGAGVQEFIGVVVKDQHSPKPHVVAMVVLLMLGVGMLVDGLRTAR